jgi:hypothetical protein
MFFIRFFSGHGHTEASWQRPNNGEVERYHRYAKADAKRNCGPLNRIPIGSYVANLQERLIKVDYKRVTLKAPTNIRKPKKQTDTYSRFKKAKMKPGLFFNNGDINRGINEMNAGEANPIDLAALYEIQENDVRVLDHLDNLIDTRKPPRKRPRVIYDSDSN